MSTQTDTFPILEIPHALAKSVVNWEDSAATSVADLQEAIHKSFKNPVGFPAVESAIIPDDTVCLVIEPEVPQLSDILCEVIHYLVQEGVLPRNIKVLVSGNQDTSGEIATQLVGYSEEFKPVEVVFHDPADSDNMAYLAATRSGDPIYLNRTLGDADVVIPICVAKPDAADWRSKVEFVFPRLSNEETIARFRQREQQGRKKSVSESCLADAQCAMRNLGVLLNLQVVPGRDQKVAQVITGERMDAIYQGRHTVQQAWHRKLEAECQMIIADMRSVEGPRRWSEVLEVAARFAKALERDGKLVICTQFGSRSGSNRIKKAPAMTKLDKKRADELLEDCHIYLYCDLARETVESLGFGWIESSSEIEHLAQHVEQCLVVPDADWSSVSID